jgi:hypothetical protein
VHRFAYDFAADQGHTQCFSYRWHQLLAHGLEHE